MWKYGHWLQGNGAEGKQYSRKLFGKKFLYNNKTSKTFSSLIEGIARPPCSHRAGARPPAAAVVAEEAAPGRPAATGDEEGAPGNWEALVQVPSCQPGTPSQHSPCPGTGSLGQRTLLPPPVCLQCLHACLRVSDVLQWAHLC